MLVPASGAVELSGDDAGQRYWLPQPLVPRAGFGPATRRGWRLLGERATMSFWRPPEGASELLLQLRRRDKDTVRGGRSLEVRVAGETVGRATVPFGRSLIRSPLPRVESPALEVDLVFRPAVVETSRRELVSLERLALVPAGGDFPAVGAATWNLGSDGTLRLEAGGHFVTPLDLPAGARSLDVGLRCAGDAETDVCAARLFVLDGDGVRHEILTWRPEAAEAKAWSREHADLSALAARQLTLVIEAAVPSRGAALEVRAAIERSPSLQESPPATTAAPAGQPDVVLIVLDAARGDRFTGDYPRPTTPHIDAMARDALTFSRAYSECPSTFCSIPSLITGRSFVSVGAVSSATPLPDEPKTLAESLQAAGYTTIGLSANPFHSAGRNLAQGYDSFVRTWGRGNPNHGPFGLSRLAAEAIAAQPPERPLFLMLHYLPPHQPYAPLPEFDLFTSPDYRGPVGDEFWIRPYNRGEKSLTDEDLAELVGRYDGNLRMADAAVEQVFAALQRAGRWENALIVVTADHGEAFMEHGLLSHNETLFDEMLHVPLIVRPPPGSRPDAVDTARPVSLIDILPTVLALVGLPPEPAASGVDLLAASAPIERTLFHFIPRRRAPTYAARSASWKAIVRPARQRQLLFDLSRDPEETRNLVGSRPWLFTGLALRLRRHLERIESRRAAAPEVAVPKEEIEALKALGYLD